MQTITERQLRELRELLINPGLHVERRVDSLLDIGTGHSKWESRVQIVVPTVDGIDDTVEGSTPPALISLGVYPKQRLPDMQATDHRGQRLPIMSRGDQTRILAVALIHDEIRHIQTPDDRREALGLAAAVIDAPPMHAPERIGDFENFVDSFLSDSQTAELVLRLRAFADVTHVLVWAEPDLSRRVIVSTTFTVGHEFPTLKSTWNGLTRARASVVARCWAMVRLAMMNMGLLAVPFKFVMNGANHAHSFYIAVHEPDGTEVETLYWRRLTARDSTSVSPTEISNRYYEGQNSLHPTLGCFHPAHDAHGGWVRLNMRIMGAGLRLIWLLLLAIILVSGYILGNAQQVQNLNRSAGWITAVIGALLAVLNERSSELKLYLSRYLQRLVLSLALLATVLGLRVGADSTTTSHNWYMSAKYLFERAPISALAALTCGFGVFLFGIVGMIAFRRNPISCRSVEGTDMAHSTYVTFAKYRRHRRSASLVTLCLSLLGAGWFIVHYSVLTDLF